MPTPKPKSTPKPDATTQPTRPAPQKTIPGPRGRHGSTRDSLLDAGLALFAEKGFDGTAVKDLEAAVGLAPGRGSFYRHFGSKEALLEAVIHREADRLRAMRDMQQRAVAGTLGDARAERILEYRLALIGLQEVTPLVLLLAHEYGRFPELMAGLRTMLVDDSVRLGGLDLANSGGDSEARAAVVLSALAGYHLARFYFGVPPGDVDSERFIATLADMAGQAATPAMQAGPAGEG